MDNLRIPKINYRVWSNTGYPNHGPTHVSIPPDIFGSVLKIEDKPGGDLYSIRWDNDQQSKHYLKDLFCIGNCKDLAEFENLIRLGKNGKLISGPKGGLVEFCIDIEQNNYKYQFKSLEYDNIYKRFLEEILSKNVIEYSKEIKKRKKITKKF